MQRCFLGCVLFAFLSSPGISFQDESWGARSRGIAGVTATLQSDPSVLGGNCAGLYSVHSIAVNLSVIPSEYGLGELKTRMLHAAFPTPYATVAAGVRDFGFDLYRETSLLVGAGFPIMDKASGGLGTEFRRIAIKGYGSQTVVLVNAGLQVSVADEILLGGLISNLLSATLGRQRERIPGSAAVGAAFFPTQSMGMFLEFQKDTRNPEVVKYAVEVNPVKFLTVRGGVRNNPLTWSFGFSGETDLLGFVYGGSNHADLGWTHQIDVTVRVQP